MCSHLSDEGLSKRQTGVKRLKIQKLKKEFLSRILHLPKVHCPEGRDVPEDKLRDILILPSIRVLQIYMTPIYLIPVSYIYIQ